MATIQDFRVRKGLIVSENAAVAGNVAISQQLTVTNAVSLANTLSVTGTSTLTGNTSIGGFANIGTSLQVAGLSTFGAANATFDTSTLTIDAVNNRVGVNTALGQTVALHVTGDANVTGTFTAANINFTNITGTTLNISANSNFDGGTLFVDSVNNRVGINNTTPDAALTVTGTANVAGAVRIGGSLNTLLASAFANTLSVAGLLSPTAGINVTGTANVSSTLGVGGATILSNTLSTTGAATFSNTISVTGAAIFSNTASVAGALSANTLTLSSPLGVTSGGTGSNTASGARTNLGLGTVSTLNTVNSSFLASAVQLVIYDSTGNTLKMLYGSGS